MLENSQHKPALTQTDSRKEAGKSSSS